VARKTANGDVLTFRREKFRERRRRWNAKMWPAF